MRDLLLDLSILTGIGKLALSELADKAIAVISHDVEESIRDKVTTTTIDVGIGTLHISVVNNELMYKFVPSVKLDKAVATTYNNRRSKLCASIDEELGKKLTTTYKDLF